MKKIMTAMVFSSVLFLAALTGCEDQQQDPTPSQTVSPSQEQQPTVPPDEKTAGNPESQNSQESTPVQETSGTIDGLKVVANPDSVTVLVDKQYALPKNYEPQDLVYPNVPFIFQEKIEKRKLRKEAADALEKLFDGAKKDGISLAGVSGYRSYDRQTKLFESYVQRDGEAAAKMYSAVPGTSEHQTGLAIDVSGIDGKCAAESCFAGTPEADWLAKHAPEYGFIVRYPEDKVEITGYEYEPWHIRYVGVQLAKELAEKGQCLEEYYNAVPVSGAK
ncbi:D-alanyl-D-alanine carboxypeptidase family protein [Brevibacillus sp. B_LB10_24]|uniref:M15 family metallopeptidase n=1 Tax=Brevibacillus sp. B_LB10_24 TaxID=3380645 RepID=UPI0038BD466D